MNLLSSILNPKPVAQPAAVPVGILPPEAPKAAAEPFQAVPPPRKTPPMPIPGRKLVIQEPAPEVVLPPPVVAVAPLEPFTAAEVEIAAPKKRGRPPGAKNKAADTLPPGSTGTGGIAQAIQNHIIDTAEASLTVRSITVTRSATVQVVQFEPMRIDVSVTADVSGLTVAEATHLLDQQVMSELVRRMGQLHEAKRDAGVLKAQGK